MTQCHKGRLAAVATALLLGAAGLAGCGSEIALERGRLLAARPEESL